jgi:hypothetical protein
VEFRETGEMEEIYRNFPKFPGNSTKLTREGFPDVTANHVNNIATAPQARIPLAKAPYC